MSRVIWKFPFDVDAADIIAGGGSPVVRHVGVDPANEDPVTPTVWVELEPGGEGWMSLRFIATGDTVPEASLGWAHVGSTLAGPYVWHVFAKVTI